MIAMTCWNSSRVLAHISWSVAFNKDSMAQERYHTFSSTPRNVNTPRECQYALWYRSPKPQIHLNNCHTTSCNLFLHLWSALTTAQSPLQPHFLSRVSKNFCSFTSISTFIAARCLSPGQDMSTDRWCPTRCQCGMPSREFLHQDLESQQAQ